MFRVEVKLAFPLFCREIPSNQNEAVPASLQNKSGECAVTKTFHACHILMYIKGTKWTRVSLFGKFICNLAAFGQITGEIVC